MNLIGLTAGHTGAGTGAAKHLDEGTETIRLRDKIKAILEKKGVTVVSDADKARLREVVAQMGRELKPYDLCLDIHFNAAADPTAHGTEVVIPDNSTAIERQEGEKLLDATCATLGTKNRGLKKESQTPHKRLAMLRDFNAQNLLLEVCFVSNKTDSEKYRAKEDELAEQIADILYRYAQTDKL